MKLRDIAVTIALVLGISPANATVWMIGDNDGYGVGIVDNGNHNLAPPVSDNRSAAEKAATNGAQYTDTYSTTHSVWSPADQTGNLATFTFTGLGSGWTEGSMWFDMADFEATTYGSVLTTYNGINQNWSFNDGFRTTKVRFFDLQQSVIDSINSTGQLVVVINRNGSGDFYGFDFAALSNNRGAAGIPDFGSTVLMLGASLLGFGVIRRNLR